MEVALQTGFVITAVPSGSGVPTATSGWTYVKITGRIKGIGSIEIMLNPLTITPVGCTAPGGSCSGAAVMQGSSNTKSDGLKIMRKGDYCTCNGTAQQSPSGTAPSSCLLTLTDAGQTKTKMNY